MQKADLVMMLKRFGHVEEYPNGRKEVRLNLDEVAGELEQLFHKHHVIGSLPLYAVNRVEVIDEAGRSYVNWHSKNSVHADLQDEGRTLKVFVSKRQ